MTELLISSTVLIAVVILLRALFKNRISRRLQYALWLIVAIRLMVPIQIGTSPISIQHMEPEKLETTITQTTREPITGPSYTVIYSQVAEEYASAGQNVQIPAIRHEIEVETAQRITVPTVGEIANTVWLLGAVVMAVWFLFVNLRFRRDLRNNATVITVPDCPIPVKVCPSLSSPCLSGLFRPTVYLTESCADDPQRLRHILAHELTHLRHGDLIWSGLRSILLCMYWFHPLVWVAAVLSKRDCELACDEGALARLGEDQRIAYGKTLLDTVARRPSPNHLLETATSMNETKKQLKERVNFIVKKPRFYLILTVCVLLITAVAIGCTFTGAPDNPNWTCPCSIMVDGVQYHTYFEKADLDTDSIAIAGNIKKQSCDISDMPTENDTSNFDTCVGEPYAWVDGQLYLRCNGQWNVCVNANTQDIPKTTTSPTEITVPTETAEAPLLDVTELFYWDPTAETNWFNYALKSAYETPADVNLWELFYSSPMGEPLTQEEIDFLLPYGLNPEVSAVHRYPVSMMDSVLQECFGISFAECNGVGLDQMVYNPDTDCYYDMHGDFISGVYHPTDAQELEDGTVKIYYDGFIYYNDYHGYQPLPMVVTLVPTADSWCIVSNLPAAELKTYTDTSWQATTEGTKLSYEDYFSKTREFTDSQELTTKRWRIDKNGAMIYVEKATDGYALLHDENGFFIVSFENYDGGDWSTGTRKDDWYQYRDDGRALEVIWQVPNTDGIKGVNHYLTDGRYVYYIQYKKFIDQVDLLTGQRYRIFEADRICVENDHCMILYDQSVLIFLNQTKDTVSINRLYLPSGRLDVLYDQIPLEQIHSGSYMHCTDSDTIHWTIMEPNFLNRLWEIVRDPNSSYHSKSRNETVLYHELFDGANSIMKSTTWKELSGHTEFIDLAQIIEINEQIPSLLHCSYNTRTGEYSETPYYWNAHMNE